VVQHVSVWHETICFHTVYGDAENSAGNHHAHLGVLLKCKLFVVWY
jgi:hypothetical protein